MAELRRDILSGRWVITGTKSKQTFFSSLQPKKKIDEKQCPFCLGNEHLTPSEIFSLREKKSSQWFVRVIPSKEPILEKDRPLEREGVGLYDMMKNTGAHELIIETPEHIKNISELSVEQIKKVFYVYQIRMEQLKENNDLRYAIIFKNQRPNNPYRYGHSHSQLVAFPLTPDIVKNELNNAKEHFSYKERCVFCDIIREEIRFKQRIIFENRSVVSFIPFAPRFPFETWIVPKRHKADFTKEEQKILVELAECLKITLTKITKLLNDPPLNYMLYSIPYLRPREGYWKTIFQDYHWHIKVLPHVLPVEGFAWSSGFYIEPLYPEVCAELLREVN